MSDHTTDRPKYKEVFTIMEATGEGKKPRWVRIGVCFPNKDGSANVILDALPINGKLNIRDPKPKEDRDQGRSNDRNDRGRGGRDSDDIPF